MLSRVFSGAVFGVDAFGVEIEVNAASHGDPQIVIVGLPDTAVRESKDRVWTAIVNSGFRPHIGRTTINLAPADKRKEGPIFDSMDPSVELMEAPFYSFRVGVLSE